MSPPGDSPTLLVQARSALLDALEALSEHRDAVIVIGAQASTCTQATLSLPSRKPQKTATLRWTHADLTMTLSSKTR